MGTLLAAGIFLLAGFCVSLLVFNRFILSIRDGRLKDAITAANFLGVAALSLVAGLASGFSAWLAIPSLFLASVGAVEMRRQWTRYRCRDLGLVETANIRLSLAQPLTTCDLALRRYEVAMPWLAGGRLRIGHISDLHISPRLAASYFESVMDLVSRWEPDVIFITGDFVTRGKYAGMLPALLKRARARYGVFGVLGNHDYWTGAQEVAQAVTAGGVRLVGSRPERIDLDGRRRIVIGGCEDPWAEGRWQPPETAGDPLLVLTHTPDNIFRIARARAAAAFAGHCHAGQVRLPGFGSVVVPSIYGRRFDHGHFRIHGTHLFVTSGIGSYAPAFRVYCQPDVFIVDLVGGTREDAPGM